MIVMMVMVTVMMMVMMMMRKAPQVKDQNRAEVRKVTNCSPNFMTHPVWVRKNRKVGRKFWLLSLFSSVVFRQIIVFLWISSHWNLRRPLEANSEATTWIRPATATLVGLKLEGCGGHWRPTRRPPLNSILLLSFCRQVVVYTDLNILLLKECMHHFGVKILEFSPGGAGETFTNQRQQAFMMQNETQRNS